MYSALDESAGENDLFRGSALISSEETLARLSGRRVAFSAQSILIGVLAVLLAIETFFLARYIPIQHLWPVPDFPLHEVSFERQLDWEYSPASHALWAGVMRSSGMVAIHKPKRYGLGPGLETSALESQVYGLVVTHEFHCLRMIRENFFGLVMRNDEYMDTLYAANASVILPEGKLDHIFHCIDYLRQTILCRADTTLEWRSKFNSHHIDGYGPPHQCRNWDDVHAWMTANLPPDPKYHEQLN